MVKQGRMPSFFRNLLDGQLADKNEILSTEDGFFMIRRSLASILAKKDITTFPDREGTILECGNFFDDWFLFAVTGENGDVYGLLKMREQEHDLERGLQADGDTPGVTVSFVAFDTAVMDVCLADPTPENRQKLGMEINRTVAYPKQSHHRALKAYFLRPQAQAPYLIGEAYVNLVASFAVDGVLAVPKEYEKIHKRWKMSGKYSRIPDFLDENNRNAGETVCDHRVIRIRDLKHLSVYEKLAILATHTGNVSLHSFAAEIRFHAMFLTRLVKIRFPLVGSAYASAIRADMSIGDKEFQGPTPYYNPGGSMIRTQMKHHPSSGEWNRSGIETICKL